MKIESQGVRKMQRLNPLWANNSSERKKLWNFGNKIKIQRSTIIL